MPEAHTLTQIISSRDRWVYGGRLTCLLEFVAIADFVRRFPNPVELAPSVSHDPAGQRINDFVRPLIDWCYFIRHDDLQLRLDGNVRFEIPVHMQLIFIFRPARLEDGAIGNDPHGC
jgi:hypothetical protein